MVVDDGFDLRPKMRESLCGKVISGQALRRLQVVECPVGPDTEVMKGGGKEQKIDIVAVFRCEKEQIVQDSVNVIPVGAQVSAKGAGERAKNVIDQWEGSAKLHGSVQRFYHRVYLFAAVV
jgi:hypothetical protein